MADIKVFGLSSEEDVQDLRAHYPEEIIQVSFANTFSYHLKFLPGYRIPTIKEHRDHTGNLLATRFHCSLLQLCFRLYLGTYVNAANLNLPICDVMSIG